MNFTVIIPARYGSTRLPAKALADIYGRPLIRHVVDQANRSNANRVCVATDDQRIAEHLTGAECEVVMTAADHQSGSDRIAEAVKTLGLGGDRLVVNVQGDEPLIPPRLINEVAECLHQNHAAVMATAARKFEDEDQQCNPNRVKVVINQASEALYFSRSMIPYTRATEHRSPSLHHVGIYAYRAEFLQKFAAHPETPLELSEGLEQLRALEMGATIAVHQFDYSAGLGVDTQDDLERVRKLMANQT